MTGYYNISKISGNYQLATGRVVAHEIAHLFGSEHDGETPVYDRNIYKKKGAKKYNRTIPELE